MSYRPITDLWFFARAKLKGGEKYYGAYLGGFPERARIELGARLDEPVLHVCGGKARLYPYRRGFGTKDETLDLDPTLNPDFLQDARDPFPLLTRATYPDAVGLCDIHLGWRAILCDPPYSKEDAKHYAPGEDKYPSPNELVRNAFKVLDVGGKVGIIHYILPACPKNGKFVFAAGVLSGFNNRIRVFSVFEKESE